MRDSIFRKKSIDKISSPEELDDYMKVTSPSTWLILSAILFLLIGVLAWSITGRIEHNMIVDGQVVSETIAPIELLLK